MADLDIQQLNDQLSNLKKSDSFFKVIYKKLPEGINSYKEAYSLIDTFFNNNENVLEESEPKTSEPCRKCVSTNYQITYINSERKLKNTLINHFEERIVDQKDLISLLKQSRNNDAIG
ncbi:hypothetical protein HHI36_016461, partial [Cryptolaemus montrouzieri]